MLQSVTEKVKFWILEIERLFKDNLLFKRKKKLLITDSLTFNKYYINRMGNNIKCDFVADGNTFILISFADINWIF